MSPKGGVCGISRRFQRLSPTPGQIPTRYSPVRHSPPPEGGFPFDLHVLGMPPAFVLSQDQTLKLRRQPPPRAKTRNDDGQPDPVTSRQQSDRPKPAEMPPHNHTINRPHRKTEIRRHKPSTAQLLRTCTEIVLIAHLRKCPGNRSVVVAGHNRRRHHSHNRKQPGRRSSSNAMQTASTSPKPEKQNHPHRPPPAHPFSQSLLCQRT